MFTIKKYRQKGVGRSIILHYLKDKKSYRLLALIVVLFAVFFNTPFSKSISKTFENTLVGIVVFLTITIFYLLIKDDKKREKSKSL